MLRGSGLEFTRAAIGDDRLVELAARMQRQAEVEMKCRNVGIHAHGLPDEIHRHVFLPDLMRDDSEQVQRIGMPRLHREDLPVDRLRLRQPPGLVMLERDLKSFGDRHDAGREHCRAHHARHICRQACPKFFAKRGASMNADTFIRPRRVARSSASRGRSAARSAARRT